MSQKTFTGLQLFSGSIQYSPSPMESHESRMSLHERGAIKILESILKPQPINAPSFCSTKSESHRDITRERGPFTLPWYIFPENTSLRSTSENKEISLTIRESMDGAVVRALASYRCSPGLIPGPGVTSEARLLSDLVRGFFSRSSGFLPPRKPTFQFPIWPGNSGQEEPPDSLL